MYVCMYVRVYIMEWYCLVLVVCKIYTVCVYVVCTVWRNYMWHPSWVHCFNEIMIGDIGSDTIQTQATWMRNYEVFNRIANHSWLIWMCAASDKYNLSSMNLPDANFIGKLRECKDSKIITSSCCSKSTWNKSSEKLSFTFATENRSTLSM